MKRLVIIFLIVAIILISVVYAGLDAKSGKVINVATPTDGTDAANKDYVDDHVLVSDPPSTTTSTGIAGTITYDSSYFYVCIATNSWKRTALSTWAVTDVLLLDDGASKLLLGDGSSYLLIR